MTRHLPVFSSVPKKRVRVRLIVIVFAMTLLGVNRPIVHSAPGDLDPTFGNGGMVLTDLFGTHDAAHDSALQTDGKIVVVGHAFVEGRTDVALVRYNANGSLDDTFGEGGKVTTDFFGWYEHAAAVALLPDNRILIGGAAARVNEESDFALVRYNADGSLDTSFGIGGKVTTDFEGLQDQIWDIAVQPDGKIIAAGTTYLDLFGTTSGSLARYNGDGSLDGLFGNGGKVLTYPSILGGSNEGVSSLAIRGDGKILLAGSIYSGVLSETDFVLMCFNEDGSRNSSFGFSGTMTTDFMNNADSASAIAIQADKKIILSGYASGNSGTLSLALARYTENGALDPTYGVGGKVFTIRDVIEVISTIALQPDGRLITGGSTFNSNLDTDFCIERYTIDGRLDTSFANQGRVTTDFAGIHNALTKVLVQPDGKIVATGYAQGDGLGDFAIARYEGALQFNMCIQDEINGNLLQLNLATGDYRFSNCRKGWTVSGTGIVKDRGCKIEFQDIEMDRNIFALLNVCTNVANASVVVSRQNGTQTVVDKNITNNTCVCQ